MSVFGLKMLGIREQLELQVEPLGRLEMQFTSQLVASELSTAEGRHPSKNVN